MKTGKRILSLILSLLFVLGTVFATFAVDGEAGEVRVRATNCGSEVISEYKETQYFEFEANNLPDGAAVHVFRNGEDMGESTYLYVNDATEDYTVEAKVLDPDGNELAASGEIKVSVKNGFFDRLKAFFKETFGTIADAVMDIFGAIFMRIWIFLHR